MKKNNEQQNKIAYNINPQLPNLFVDDMRISVRNDKITMINFLTNTPEGKFEQTRIMISGDRLKEFVETICKHIDFYPTKKETEPRPN